MPYGRIPKIVATFTYTGPINPLRNRLNGALWDALAAIYLQLRQSNEYDYKIDIVTLPNNRFEYYPKVSTLRPFTDAEIPLVNNAVDSARAAIQNELVAQGATNITIHYSYAAAGM
jgi:hypothetical protein